MRFRSCDTTRSLQMIDVTVRDQRVLEPQLRPIGRSRRATKAGAATQVRETRGVEFITCSAREVSDDRWRS